MPAFLDIDDMTENIYYYKYKYYTNIILFANNHRYVSVWSIRGNKWFDSWRERIFKRNVAIKKSESTSVCEEKFILHEFPRFFFASFHHCRRESNDANG